MQSLPTKKMVAEWVKRSFEQEYHIAPAVLDLLKKLGYLDDVEPFILIERYSVNPKPLPKQTL